MANFLYALMKAGSVVEYRAFPQAMTVGPGAVGELADMVAVDASVLPPAPPVPPSPREWLERLSPATELAIETAGLTNAAISLWLRKATGVPFIDVTLPETIAGVAAMVAAGLLTTAEQATLLAP